MINIVISYSFKIEYLNQVSKIINRQLEEIQSNKDNILRCDIYRVKFGLKYFFVIRYSGTKSIYDSPKMKEIKDVILSLRPYYNDYPKHIDTFIGDTHDFFV